MRSFDFARVDGLASANSFSVLNPTWDISLDNFCTTHYEKFNILHLNLTFYYINLILEKNKFAFVFIQESKLGDLADEFISNKYYNLLRRDRQSGGGGLLVYTKKCYVLLDPFIDLTYETISFSVRLNKQKYTFISSYNPHFAYSKDY